jgi:protease-4
MRNTFVPADEKKSPQPMSGTRHFWLSFLAVITGVPVSIAILSTGFFIVSLIFVLMISLALGSGAQNNNEMLMQQVYGDSVSSNTIVSVPIRGVILSGSAADPLQTLFGQSYADGEQIKEQLRALADDETVDGVILEIDSPGGMITASKAIADGIDYYREKTNKPIIAHINGTGASGAYWAAATTDRIYAEQGSEAGSIGVIMGPLVTLNGVVSYGDVSTNQPIGFKYYSAGRSKDLGNPFRAVTPEEDAFINQQIQAEYEKFVTHVASTRGLTAETIKNEIGALAYGTDDAMRLKLIDGVSSKEDAYEALAVEAGVADDFKLMQIDNAADFFGSLFGARTLIESMRMSGVDKSAGRARFCETNLLDKPLVFNGDIRSVCQ